MTTSESTYLFDHARDLELERLKKLEEWQDPGTIRHLETIGVGPGWRCLEVAAGAGSITRWLSDRVGATGHVLATDLDLKFLEDLSLPNVEVRKHDILTDHLPDGAFDLVHSRLLLMHLPARDEAFRRMLAATKPGGWIFVEDFDMHTWIDVVPSGSMDRLREAFIGLLRMAGADPFYGRNHPKLFLDHGLADAWVEGRVELGRRHDSPGLIQFKISLVQLRDMLAANGIATVEDVDEVIRLIDDQSWVGLPPMTVAAFAQKPLG